MSLHPASSLELSRTCHILRRLVEPSGPLFRSRRPSSLVPQYRVDLFGQLSQAFQNRIYGIVYRLAESPQNVEFNWGEVHVFDSFPRLQSAIHELACNIFDGLNTMQRDFVAGWVFHHAGRPSTTDLNWGQTHAKDDTDRLLLSLNDYFEIEPEIQETQEALAGWLIDDFRQPDEQRETAAQRVVSFISDPRRSLPFTTQIAGGDDHILDLSGLHLTDISFLSMPHIGVRVEALNLSHNHLTRFPRLLPSIFPHLKHCDISHNRIALLDVESLLSLPSLRILEVANNRLQFITKYELTGAAPRLLVGGLSNQASVASDPEADLAYLRRLVESERSSPAPQPSDVSRFAYSRAPEGRPSQPPQPSDVSRFAYSRAPEGRPSQPPQSSGVSRFAYSRAPEARSSQAPQPSGVSRFAVQRGPGDRPLPASQQNGVAYIEAAIRDHLNSLSEEEAKDFKKLMSDYDEEIFSSIPRFVIDQAITSLVPLTKDNVPKFLHKHVEALEKLRKKREKFDKEMARMNKDDKDKGIKEIYNDVGHFVYPLTQDREFSADMQKALEKFS